MKAAEPSVVLDEGSLVFQRDAGSIQGAIAAGRWDAVLEAAPDDSPQLVETRRGTPDGADAQPAASSLIRMRRSITSPASTRPTP